MNLQNYLEQHKKIKEELKYLSDIINDITMEEKLSDIALHINTLAGRLNMHLTMEDKYLYPSLREKGDTALKTMAEEYEKEMGGLFEAFKSYKETYNTKNKLASRLKEFKADTNEIMKKISERMDREEQGLYQSI